jgi:hypothetical protein
MDDTGTTGEDRPRRRGGRDGKARDRPRSGAGKRRGAGAARAGREAQKQDGPEAAGSRPGRDGSRRKNGRAANMAKADEGPATRSGPGPPDSSAGQDGSTVWQYVDRMTLLQLAINDPKNQLAKVRKEAGASGLNIDALVVLSNLRVRDPDDGGAATLTDLVRYARATGVEIEGTGPTAMASGTLEDEADPPLLPDFGVEEESEDLALARVRRTFVLQILIATGVAALFLWLLH